MIRRVAVMAFALGVVGCATPAPRPSPVSGVPDPAKVLADSGPGDWEPVSAEDVLLMRLKTGEEVVILLAPAFAPVHVANIKAMARGGYWRDATVYRVVDNWVTQWGVNEARVALPDGVVERPPAEYDRPIGGLKIRPLPYPDPYAAGTGHAAGWAVAFDRRADRAWLPHCYGSVGVARDLAPDTGAGGELYAVIGHAPRQLDRNIAVVGRVVEGMPALASLKRGTGPQGVYRPEAGEAPVPVASVRLAADLPEGDRPRFERLKTDTVVFERWVTGLANRSSPFFTVPSGGVDVCQTRVPVRRSSTAS